MRLAAAKLEEGRDRRLEVGNQRGPHHLRLAPPIAFGEGGFRRLDLHGTFYCCVAAADDLIQRGLIDGDAEVVFQPRDIFGDDVVGVRILQHIGDRLALLRIGIEAQDR